MAPNYNIAEQIVLLKFNICDASINVFISVLNRENDILSMNIIMPGLETDFMGLGAFRDLKKVLIISEDICTGIFSGTSQGSPKEHPNFIYSINDASDGEPF